MESNQLKTQQALRTFSEAARVKYLTNDNEQIAEMSIERDNVDIMSTFPNQLRYC